MNAYLTLIALVMLSQCGYVLWLAIRAGWGPGPVFAFCLAMALDGCIWDNVTGLTISGNLVLGLLTYVFWFLLWSLREQGLLSRYPMLLPGNGPTANQERKAQP